MGFDIRAEMRVILFLLVAEAFALVLARDLSSQDIQFVEGEAGVGSSVIFFLLIMGATALLLVIIKFGLSRYLYILTEYVGLFFITMFIAGALTDRAYAALALSIAMVALRRMLRDNERFDVISSMVVCVGTSSIIGITFGPVPLIALLVLLSAYDFIAVKKTKHMIRVAEDVVRKRGPQMISFSSSDDEIMIGLADLIFPSALFISVYLAEGLVVAAMTSCASIIGLTIMFGGQINEGMPAIPYVSLGVAGYLLGIALI